VGGVSIDGAPIAYVIVLAAVLTALGFVPFSAIISAGGTFPLSQGVFPLVGWLLGPLAGAVAGGVGRLAGILLSPGTASSVWPASVWGAAVGSFAAGAMQRGRGRRLWWVPLAVIFALELVAFVGRAVVVNGVGPWVALGTSFVNWSALLLFILPTRRLLARWIQSENMAWVSAGLFLGTWMIAGLSHLSATVFMYWVVNWPAEVWATLIPIIPLEHLFRSLVGTVIGAGVIAGLRAIGLVKPRWALY
jgi:hypothetical protein